MELRKIRNISVMMTDHQLVALDRWRRRHMVWSRSDAIRQMIDGYLRHEQIAREQERNKEPARAR